MARLLQTGLDYFPLDTNVDDTIELLEAKFGIEGFGIFIKLLQKIYSNNYYLDWNEEIKLLFVKKNSLNINVVNDILNYCLEKNIFNNNLFIKFSILTSSGIQARYFKAIERRKNIKIINEYILIDLKKINANMDLINVNINSQNVNINSQNVNINSQSKVNYSKEEEIKENINKNKSSSEEKNDDDFNSDKLIQKFNLLAETFSSAYKGVNQFYSKSSDTLKVLLSDNKFDENLFFQKLTLSAEQISNWSNAPIDMNWCFKNTDNYYKIINGEYIKKIAVQIEDDPWADCEIVNPPKNWKGKK